MQSIEEATRPAAMLKYTQALPESPHVPVPALPNSDVAPAAGAAVLDPNKDGVVDAGAVAVAETQLHLLLRAKEAIIHIGGKPVRYRKQSGLK